MSTSLSGDCPLVTAESLSIQYPSRSEWVLDEVDFQQFTGQVTALIGPSGCGKSSLIRTITGIIPHTLPSTYSGSISLAQEEIADASVKHLSTHVSYVGQNPDSSILSQRVIDEVTFALKNLCLDREEIISRTWEALDRVGMRKFANMNPWNLSGGWRQRLSLAVALAQKAPLIVLDEPTSMIDTQGKVEFYNLLPELAKSGSGIIVVDHDLDPLLHTIDEVYAFNREGRIIHRGHPREIFLQHANELNEQGMWLPRSIRAWIDSHPGENPPSDWPLTCTEAGISLPQLSDFRESSTLVKDSNSAEDFLKDKGENPDGNPPLLSLRDLEVPGRLRKTSLDLRAGELLAVVGENGAGKSSLLYAIAGLLPFKATRAEVEGQEIQYRKHQVGYVFQNPEHQFIANTVSEEIAFGGASSEVVEKLLDSFHLQSLRQAHPMTLSGGQARRLSVATMASQEHTVIALDEPTYGQDWHHTQELMSFIKELCSHGKTVIFATHDLELARVHADRVILIDPIEESEKEKESVRLNPKTLEPIVPQKGAFRAFNPFTLTLAVLVPMLTLLVFRNLQVNLIAMGIGSLLVALSGIKIWKKVGLISLIWGIILVITPGIKATISGSITYGAGSWHLAFEMTSLLAAIIALVLGAGSNSHSEQVIQEAVKRFHLPSRIALAGTTALSFRYRFTQDFRTMRQARALRGLGNDWGFFAPVRRWANSLVPLVVTAARQGERVALAMDTRGYGAYPRRTELVDYTWNWYDTLFIAVVWLGTIVGAIAYFWL
ncbi:ATP-binding cassette domain-containing protein [Actinomycetaceae bacterium TAE3-ERU4]|nr:ATP-binding cassette domain-containing protein [Actinomycetaceae bacterium TAE3-ERU4]